MVNVVNYVAIKPRKPTSHYVTFIHYAQAHSASSVIELYYVFCYDESRAGGTVVHKGMPVKSGWDKILVMGLHS